MYVCVCFFSLREWQYAASNAPVAAGTAPNGEYQGGTLYPWGNEALPEEDLPAIYHGKNPPPPPAVTDFPSSCSQYPSDTPLCGLTGWLWEWTEDAYCDVHTCGGLLRGGSYYKPDPSTLFDPDWYFPQAYRNDQRGKLMLLSDSFDRNGMTTFRVAT